MVMAYYLIKQNDYAINPGTNHHCDHSLDGPGAGGMNTLLKYQSLKIAKNQLVGRAGRGGSKYADESPLFVGTERYGAYTSYLFREMGNVASHFCYFFIFLTSFQKDPLTHSSTYI